MLQRKVRGRVEFTNGDRLFFIQLYRWFPSILKAITTFRTKTKSPQTNGICERFHKTVLNEFCRVAFRKKVYRSIDELQTDLDLWVREYNEVRPHQGRW